MNEHAARIRRHQLVDQVDERSADQDYVWIAAHHGRDISCSRRIDTGVTPDQYQFTSLEGASYANVVPEPGTALLFGMGLAGLASRTRRG